MKRTSVARRRAARAHHPRAAHRALRQRHAGCSNIQGASRLSDLDGAGGIRADYADDVSMHVHGNWGGMAYGCETAYETTVAFMQLTAGKKVRAVIAWDTDPDYASYDMQPSADLDLRIKDPAGTVIQQSVSWDNTYEIVELIVETTGLHTMAVSKARCGLSPRWLGWAWFTQ